MRWNKNGYTVTVRINLFAVGDGGGDLCTTDPGSSHADIACFVVDTLAGVKKVPARKKENREKYQESRPRR